MADPTMRDYIAAADGLRSFAKEYERAADAFRVDNVVIIEVLRAMERCHDFTRFFATLIEAQQAETAAGSDVVDTFDRGQ